MADQQYLYNVQNDFPNQAVHSGTLNEEISTSNVTVALRAVSDDGITVTVTFKAALGTDDLSLLDAVVVAHQGNAPVLENTPVEVKNIPDVHSVKHVTDGAHQRVYSFSIDWTKKKTWYHDAVKAINEAVGTGDGSTTSFSLDHGGTTANEKILDLTNGYVTDEQFILAPGDQVPTGFNFGSGYSPLVTIDEGGTDGPVPQIEKNSYDPASVGHYTIDHDQGVLNFFTPPPSGATIVATYWYVADGAKGTMLIQPPAGKKWSIDVVEAQFSKNLIMNDVVLQNQFAGANPVFPMDIEYRRIGAFLDYTLGSYPVVPAFGGLSQDTIILRWEFATTIELRSLNNENIKAWLKNGTEFGGERATLTWYAVELDDI